MRISLNNNTAKFHTDRICNDSPQPSNPQQEEQKQDE